MKSNTFLLLNLLILCSCGGTNSDTNDTPPLNPDDHYTEFKSSISRQVLAEAPADFEQFSEDNDNFALDLFFELDEVGENVLYSPFSVGTALALVYAGSGGETKSQMANALHFHLDDTSLHANFNYRLTELEQRNLPSSSEQEALQLNVVNAVWPSVNYPPLQTYLDTLALNYGTGVYALDYQNQPELSRQTINSAVMDWTEGLIIDLLPPSSITSDTILVLTNTLYLYAPWLTPFNEAFTHEANFANLDQTISTVDMMTQTVSLEYAELEGTEYLAIPYRGKELELFVIMPPIDQFEATAANLNISQIKSVRKNLQPANVSLFFPKFSLESDFELSESLKNLGMVNAFESIADFSPMGIDGRIAYVFHQTRIEFHEAGTEAAAATAVVIVEVSLPPSVRVDRPFVFIIHDKTTDSILFFGKVVEL